MSSIVFRIKPDGFVKLARQLDQMEARIPRAIAFGLNEGGDKVRTQVQRGLQEQTSLIKYDSVLRRVGTMRAFGTNAPKSGVGPTQPAGLAYQIIVRGKPSTRIDEFKFRVKTGKGGYVAAKMWGVDRIFKRSFQMKGASGSAGLRARRQTAREPIRGFDGPNLAEELGRGIVPGRFYATAAFAVPVAIIKHLGKAL
jgi:hypothetical protein